MKELKTKRLIFVLTEQEHKWLKEASKKEFRTMANILRMLINQKFNKD
jgi:hypothetical protein